MSVPNGYDRHGRTRKLHINAPDGGITLYATLTRLEDGQPWDLIFTCNKQGTTERGLLHTLGVTASLYLQNGGTLEKLVEKWRGVAFDPAGGTGSKDTPWVKSIVDYIALWLSNQETSNATTAT